MSKQNNVEIVDLDEFFESCRHKNKLESSYYWCLRRLDNIKDIPYYIKWTFQKIFRSHHTSDLELIGFDYHLAKIVFKKIRAFRKAEKSGIPLSFFPEGIQYRLKEGGPNDLAEKVARERLNKFLHDVELAWKIKCTDLYDTKKLSKLFNEYDLIDVYGVFGKCRLNRFLKVDDSKYKFNSPEYGAYIKETCELHRLIDNVAKEGMKEFVKYYDTLWL